MARHARVLEADVEPDTDTDRVVGYLDVEGAAVEAAQVLFLGRGAGTRRANVGPFLIHACPACQQAGSLLADLQAPRLAGRPLVDKPLQEGQAQAGALDRLPVEGRLHVLLALQDGAGAAGDGDGPRPGLAGDGQGGPICLALQPIASSANRQPARNPGSVQGKGGAGPLLQDVRQLMGQ